MRIATRAAPFLSLSIIACIGEPPPTAPRPDPRWSLGPALPIPLMSAGAAAYRGAVWVVGGDSEEGASLATWRLRPGAASWERMADLPATKVSADVVVSGDSLYVVGGDTQLSGRVFYPDRRIYVYDLTANAWQERARLPDLRNGTAVSVPGGVAIVGGGFGHPDHGGVYPGDSVARYDAARGVWRYGAPIRNMRMRPLAVSDGSRVHVMGGNSLDATGVVLDVELYDAAADTWVPHTGSMLRDLSLTLAYAYTRLNDAIHMIGGIIGVPGGGITDLHVRYDLQTDLWQALPPLPTPRAGASAVALDGKIYVLGGFIRPRSGAGALTSIVEIYTP